MYLDDEQCPIVPGENLEAAMVDGGKKFKLGETCKAGILIDGAWPLLYHGPRTLDGLRADPRFRDLRGARVQQNRVMRCRPKFVDWSLRFTIHYLPDLLDEKQVFEILHVVGRVIGIGDFTPKYGRFTVV